MRLLSLDIGIKNLGWALFEVADERITDISFGLHSLEKANKPNVIIGRSIALYEFLNTLSFDKVVIERQVNDNINAMNIMYCIVGMLVNKVPVVIFDAKTKFTYANIEYCTKNKAHKRLSIELARKVLKGNACAFTEHERITEFEHLTKKDDVSDAIVQGVTTLSKDGDIALSSTDLNKIYSEK